MTRHRLTIIALMSLSLIALELVWTRIFSAEFFYTFAFLVLSLAILGLGLGGLILRLVPRLDRDGTVGVALSLSGMATLVAPILVFELGLKFSELASSPAMIARFVAAVILLSSAFFFGGIALALLFRRHHTEMPRLYMADLLGAGAGVVVILVLMSSAGTPAATFLSALPMLAAACLASRRWMRVVPVLLAVVAVALCPLADGLLEVERPERGTLIYRHWDAMAKIKLLDFAGSHRGIVIDNVANSPVIPFDGNFDDPELEQAQWGIDVSYLIDEFEQCRFLSLGAGGGSDVLQALVEGAAEVHAVEVNPHINHMMVDGDSGGYLEPELADQAVAAETGDEKGDATAVPPPVLRNEEGEIITLAEYSGGIYRDSRVVVVSEDARTYIRRHHEAFDLVYSLSSNTWAALGSGAFAFAENYLFTKEAFQDYWRALSPDGYLSMEHQVYMPRLVSAVLGALAELGVERPQDHIAVYDLPQMRRNLLLLSKKPLTDRVRNNAYGELSEDNFEHIHLLYPAPPGLEDNLVNRIITEGWQEVAITAPVDISPSTDDRPFVAQMGLWKNFQADALDKVNPFAEFRGFPLSKVIIVTILLVVGVLVLPLNLVPYLRRGERLPASGWLYFLLIGVAFMSAEVVLIQKYALFIGASVYSIAAVLLTVLVASGIGSRFSERFGPGAAFGGIVACLVLHAFIFGHLADLLAGLPLALRVMVTAVLVAPLGFFMGMPFPKGARRVGELIDWGFAVNGAASVLGATAIMMVAFAHGFAVALLLAAVVYLGAWALLGRLGTAAGSAT